MSDWNGSEIGAELPPNAGNLATSLQDFGYNFEKAIADLVDNSISHGKANNIWIEIDYSNLEESNIPFVSVIDDGIGMNLEELERAIVYGSESHDEKLNLGRFGLGMNTASTSISNVLTVSSRKNLQKSFETRTWDLNFLRSKQAAGKWLILNDPPFENLPEKCKSPIQNGTGTIIYLSDLSKMIPKLASTPTYNINQILAAKKKHLIFHLEMVFHRFLSGTTIFFPKKKINIFVNGIVLNPWDPFARWHQASRHHKLDEQELVLEHEIEDEQDGRISLSYYGKVMSISSYIVPKQIEHYDQALFGVEKTANELIKYVSRDNGKDSSGIYFYRLDRIIQAGKWSSLVAVTDHTKLGRMSIDVGRDWDSELKLNVTKTYVNLPPGLTGSKKQPDDLRKIITNIRKYAELVYDNKTPTIYPPGFEPQNDENEPETVEPETVKPKIVKPKPNPKKTDIPIPQLPKQSSFEAQIITRLIEKLRKNCENEFEKQTLEDILSRLEE
jgi:anti-sigma regulatory factor (Ser/Thr protein kinase)